MPRTSTTDNVKKLCHCKHWKTCQHPWYLDYQQHGMRHRRNLDKLTGRHAPDFNEAKNEARRAIVATQTGRDPKGLLEVDESTIAEMLAAYAKEKPRPDPWQIPRITKTIIETPTGRRRFGDLRAASVTADTLKAFQRARPKVAGNRDLALLRSSANWAVLKGILPRTPFRAGAVGDVIAVRLARELPRSRRLQGTEPERLLAAAGGLQDIVLAALETGCRTGEILSMQWHQVRFSPRAEIFLPAGKTKTARARRIPISSVLVDILTRRRLDPAGELLPPDAYVFGNAIGGRRPSFKKAWMLTVKRAKVEDLHFHDLRREAGSRWMDAGIPLATIQRWLGHVNISQTSTYLGASLGADELDMQTYETRIGRLTPLTQIDVSSGRTGSNETVPDTGGSQKPQQNPIVH